MRNNDSNIGTEELAHLEMVGTIVHQLTRNLSMEEIEKAGFAPYYVDHFTVFSFVNPHFSSAYSKGIDKNVRCGVLLKF